MQLSPVDLLVAVDEAAFELTKILTEHYSGSLKHSSVTYLLNVRLSMLSYLTSVGFWF